AALDRPRPQRDHLVVLVHRRRLHALARLTLALFDLAAPRSSDEGRPRASSPSSPRPRRDRGVHPLPVCVPRRRRPRQAPPVRRHDGQAGRRRGGRRDVAVGRGEHGQRGAGARRRVDGRGPPRRPRAARRRRCRRLERLGAGRSRPGLARAVVGRGRVPGERSGASRRGGLLGRHRDVSVAVPRCAARAARRRRSLELPLAGRLFGPPRLGVGRRHARQRRHADARRPRPSTSLGRPVVVPRLGPVRPRRPARAVPARRPPRVRLLPGRARRRTVRRRGQNLCRRRARCGGGRAAAVRRRAGRGPERPSRPSRSRSCRRPRPLHRPVVPRRPLVEPRLLSYLATLHPRDADAPSSFPRRCRGPSDQAAVAARRRRLERAQHVYAPRRVARRGPQGVGEQGARLADAQRDARERRVPVPRRRAACRGRQGAPGRRRHVAVVVRGVARRRRRVGAARARGRGRRERRVRHRRRRQPRRPRLARRHGPRVVPAQVAPRVGPQALAGAQGRRQDGPPAPHLPVARLARRAAVARRRVELARRPLCRVERVVSRRPRPRQPAPVHDDARRRAVHPARPVPAPGPRAQQRARRGQKRVRGAAPCARRRVARHRRRGAHARHRRQRRVDEGRAARARRGPLSRRGLRRVGPSRVDRPAAGCRYVEHDRRAGRRRGRRRGRRGGDAAQVEEAALVGRVARRGRRRRRRRALSEPSLSSRILPYIFVYAVCIPCIAFHS
ncbi:uncharacterized protein RHOBADRAFT_55212, partial [Rhodotorula graminis WP1]